MAARRWAVAAAAFGLTFGAAMAPGARAHAAADERPAGVRLEMTDEKGPVLADGRGLTLYTWAGDRKAGESLCGDAKYTHVIGSGEVSYDLPDPDKRASCSKIWPPFAAAADAKPVGAWTIIARADGTRQWALGGKPLYTFVEDHQPGEINGLGGSSGRLVSGRYPVWGPIDAPGGVVAANTAVGRVLTTDKGQVLYSSKGGVTKASTCVGDCEWKPLSAPAVAEAPKGWSIAALPDGSRQWVFQGKAVYTHTGESRLGDIDDAAQRGWQPITLQKRLAPPSDLTVQITADGEVFADKNGMTVYSWGCVDEAPDKGLCDIPGSSPTYRRALCGPADTCIKTWRPVVAAAGAKPVGRTWSIVTIDPTGAEQYAAAGQTNGLRVWAYRGRPIYTFAGDKDPGDMNGHNVRSFVLWGYGMVRADGGGRGGF